MTGDLENKVHKQRLAKLTEEKKRILALPSEKSLDAILSSPQALPLVHSFTEEDFYLLIHDIGIEDSLPLLSIASERQWEYILDLELWEKDEFNNTSAIKWLTYLLETDRRRLVNWIKKEKKDLFKLFLYKNIEMRIREHDQDPSELGKDFITLDDVYYIRFIDYPYKPKLDNEERSLREQLIYTLLELIASDDSVNYQHFLLESSAIIPAESEEEAYRLRNVRLAEKGFVPFDEAIGIYQMPHQKKLKTIRKRSASKPSASEMVLSVPLSPISLLKEETLFSRGLKEIDESEIIQHLQLEFAGLCNQIIVADQKEIKEKEALSGIVKKTYGYLNIGFQKLAENDNPDANHVASLLKNYSLIQIFRTGFGEALKLKWKADKWQKKSWYMQHGLPLTFWDEKWMGVIGGLLIKRPLFFDDYSSGILYREFESFADITKTGNVLDEIIATDNLFSLITTEIEPEKNRFLTYKNFILTLWARSVLKKSKPLKPISTEDFKIFYTSLFGKNTASQSESSREYKKGIGISVKTLFLNWLSDETGLTDFEINSKLGQTFENLFTEVENELGEVPGEALDPRFIQLFWVQGHPDME